jgi:nitroreductase
MNFLKLARNRYSCRSYQSTPVEAEKLNYVLEAGRIAPSAANRQPWHFLVIQNEDTRKKLFAAYQREWYVQAPVHLIICGNKNQSWKRSYDGMDALDIDIAIATDHITLAATEQGLATCWICNFDPQKCREILDLPDEITPIVILSLGYPVDEVNPERHETARKKSEEIIHYEKY